MRAVTAAVLGLLFTAATQAGPRSDYLLHCGGCHLENGAGNPPEVPDLRRDIDWLAGSAEGRSYLTRVPGASQVPISDARLAGVFNWILDTYYPNGAGIRPFTGAEIARTRGQPLYDPLAARAELVAREATAINEPRPGS
jgi:hypothetical protein